MAAVLKAVPILKALPPEVEERIWEFAGYYRDQFRRVLFQIRQRPLKMAIRCATTCHGCGCDFPVVFHGFVNKFCSMECFHANEHHDFSSLYCSCHLEEYHTTRANSRHDHISHCLMNETGHYWPMLSSMVRCYNNIVRYKPPVHIPGYNDIFYVKR